jgi:hypothetical protein
MHDIQLADRNLRVIRDILEQLALTVRQGGAVAKISIEIVTRERA